LLPDSISHATLVKVGVLGGLVLELPLCAVGNFKLLSSFSFAGISSTVAVVLLVVALPVVDPRREWLQEAPTRPFLGPGIIPATGVIAVRVSGANAPRCGYQRNSTYAATQCRSHAWHQACIDTTLLWTSLAPCGLSRRSADLLRGLAACAALAGWAQHVP
jgi:hypothetical protein